MRCKNCGTDNDDNRYICENCGSPLYDEESINSDNTEKTQAFKPVSDNDKLDLGYTPEIEENDNTHQKKNDDKKSIIVIAILAVVLIAVIASVIVIAQGKKDAEITTTESTTITTTQAENTTQKQTTTKPTTTKATTTTTTTTTTELTTYSIKLVSKGGGTVDGSGTYQDGENVTIIATADEGYVFDGWYSNGEKISSTERYSFTATESISISAVFVAEQVEEIPVEDLE